MRSRFYFFFSQDTYCDFFLSFLVTDGEHANEHNEFEIDDKSGIVTRMTWMEYPKSSGWIPGLVYIVAALGYQILRVYTDLWLSRWTDQSDQRFIEESKIYSSINERQDVNR